MDKRTRFEKVALDSKYANEARKLIKNLKAQNHINRKEYLRKLSISKLKIIENLIYNILNGNIAIDYLTHEKLKRIKGIIRLIITKKLSKSKKIKILTSFKGLYLFSLILPYIHNFLKI